MKKVSEIDFTPIRWRPRKETLSLMLASKKFAQQEKPVTVRQIFYHLVSIGMLENTKEKYFSLDKFLVKARKAGYIPFEWIEDRSRHSLIVPLYLSISDYIQEKILRYWKDTWENQPYFIVILLEKEALSGIVWSVASYFNVPVFPTKGYSSWSMFADDIRKMIKKYSDKQLVVLILGDYDPSGTDIPRDHLNKLEFFRIYPDVIKRIALTKDQVIKYRLPPQMAKKDDPRYDKFKQEHGKYAVELDALTPSLLKQIVREAILEYLDAEAFKEDLKMEEQEKAKLWEIVEKLDLGFD